MTALMIFGQPAQFIRHDGWSASAKQRRRKAVKGIKLPSRTRVSHQPTKQIQELVALSYGLHPRSMTSQNRERRVAWPRQIAMFLTREITERSLPEIGRVFGGRDHSTVVHAIQTVKRKMALDPLVALDVAALRRALTE